MLTIKDLRVHFTMRDQRRLKALRGANLSLKSGETLALIGESGCGKSVLGLSVISLLPGSASAEGEIFFEGRNLLEMDERQLVNTRGKKIGFIPQSAGLSLNPTMKVVHQVAEAAPGGKNNGAGRIALELLNSFGLGREQALDYPHRLSGGMRQRVLAAIGLATKPRFLIADEPTKGVDHQRLKDVTGLFQQMKRDNAGMSLLLVTHDLGFAASIADRIAVMYAGAVVEISRSGHFFREPKHPYSRALLEAAPEYGLQPIPGMAPRVEEDFPGCAFAPRCQLADRFCRRNSPAGEPDGDEIVYCWRYAQA